MKVRWGRFTNTNWCTLIAASRAFGVRGEPGKSDRRS